MVEPRVVPRAGHPLSRRDVDPDALRVLYRLRQFSHTAYLVGGSVRDLLIGRRPKDFDIGTSAHPYQVMGWRTPPLTDPALRRRPPGDRAAAA